MLTSLTSSTHPVIYFIIEDTQVGQTFFILNKSILIVSSHLLLHLPRNTLKECLLSGFPRDENGADCLFSIALLAFLEDRNVQFSFL